MDVARIKQTGEEIDAKELSRRVKDENHPWNRSVLKKIDFICIGCNLIVEPASFEEKNIPTPYFRGKKLKPHDLNCDVEGYYELAVDKLRHPVSDARGFPCSYPSKLILPEIKEVVRTSRRFPELLGSSSDDPLGEFHQNHDQSSIPTHSLVHQLRRIIYHFVEYADPIDRRACSLTVPGMEKTTYENAFHRLSYRENYFFIYTKIYFAQIAYSRIEITESLIKLPMTPGIWIDNKPHDTFFLEIDLSTWSKSRKDIVIRNIKECQKELKGQELGAKKRMWLFFLGQQVPNEFKFQLYRNDFRVVYCILSETLHNESNSPIAVYSEPIQRLYGQKVDLDAVPLSSRLQNPQDELGDLPIPSKPFALGPEASSSMSGSPTQENPESSFFDKTLGESPLVELTQLVNIPTAKSSTIKYQLLKSNTAKEESPREKASSIELNKMLLRVLFILRRLFG